MKKSEIMKKFYGWLDEKYGNAHPHRQHMKMAWMEAFKQGVEFATQPSVEDGRAKSSELCADCKEEFGHPDNCIGCPNDPL